MLKIFRIHLPANIIIWNFFCYSKKLQQLNIEVNIGCQYPYLNTMYIINQTIRRHDTTVYDCLSKFALLCCKFFRHAWLQSNQNVCFIFFNLYYLLWNISNFAVFLSMTRANALDFRLISTLKDSLYSVKKSHLPVIVQ